MRKNNNPVVSIIIITYNSSKYVLETLQSALSQTYLNIELIISDDCSTDDTVKICQNWLTKNRKRFNKAELITTTKNSGIASNCNRGAKSASGEWIKIIAGDDVLENDIIERYIKYIRLKGEVSILYSNVRIYRNEFTENNLLPEVVLNKLPFNQNETTAEEQFEILLRSNSVWASTIMIERSILKKVGWYNEDYPFFEDRPLLLAVLKAGYKIHYLDFFGAKYRRHSESVQINNQTFLSKNRLDIKRFFISEYLNYYTLKEQKELKREYKKILLLKKIFNNKANVVVKILSRLL